MGLIKNGFAFFPIVQEQHWVVTCINIFLKQINFFNSINGSTIIPCYEASNNLVANFSKAALELQIFKEDVSQFVHKYPTEFPHQHTLNDCGVYSMLYIESWNGKKMDVACESSMIGDYRKYAMGGLLLSPMNEVNTSDFVEKHFVQD
ncbi:hypothetical protein PVAP13_5NG216000 [Panicum virgatum]|uniref:Ubiquitin-like protease family profile domain-containing protein n=1 Tax=Panicum virgatum TaxID=38727 RepID=A0A8T0RT56_PANVG|nr:hypothetical protein PVAP13_5NG216000 [Panicum virgatum]